MKVAVLSTLYLKSEHQHRIDDNYCKIVEYLHEFAGEAAGVLVQSSGVGLPWSRLAEKCPLLL